MAEECDICGESFKKGERRLVHPADEDGPRTVVHDECPVPVPAIEVPILSGPDLIKALLK